MIGDSEIASIEAYGDSDFSSEDIKSPKRMNSFKKPKMPSKRRSLRSIGIRKSRPYEEVDSAVLDYETDSALPYTSGRLSSSPESDSARVALQRSATFAGKTSHGMRSMERELEQSRNKTALLEGKLRELEIALLSSSEEVDKWKKKYRDATEDATYLRDEREQEALVIQQLQDEVAALRKQMAQAEKDKGVLHVELNTAIASLAQAGQEHAETKIELTAQLSVSNKANAELREKLAETESLLKSCSTQLQQVQHKHETEQRAHLVIIKTLESELDKVKAEPQHSRRRSSLFRKPSLPILSDSPTAPDEKDQLLLQLAEQNRALQEEIEALRLMEPAIPSPSEAKPADGVSLESFPPANQERSKGPRIPMRTSSVRELLHMKSKVGILRSDKPLVQEPLQAGDNHNNRGGNGTLAAELQKSQLTTAELDRLRAENLALVNYLVATLDAVNKTLYI